MPEKRRITVALAQNIMDMLDRICVEKGVTRPAALSIAVEKLWKEEYGDEK